MDLSKEAKILDLTQVSALPPNTDAFPLILPLDLQRALVDSGEWKVYMIVPPLPYLSLTSSHGGRAWLPTMYGIALWPFYMSHATWNGHFLLQSGCSLKAAQHE